HVPPPPASPPPPPPPPPTAAPASDPRRPRPADPGLGSGHGARSEPGFGPRPDARFGPRPWPDHPAEMRAAPGTAARPSRPGAEPGSRAAGPAAPRAPWAPEDDRAGPGSDRRGAGQGPGALRSPVPDRGAGPRRGVPGPAPREFGLEEDGLGAGRSRRKQVQDWPADQDPAEPGSRRGRGSRPVRSGTRPGRRRGRSILLAVVLVLVLGAAAAAGVVLHSRSSSRSHELVVPSQLGSYVRQPQLEQQMNARALQQQVIAKSAGQASHVVSAVYENRAGVSGTAPPQIFLFIGGGPAGGAPAGGRTRPAAQFRGGPAARPRPQAGRVAARSSAAGSMALCAWADGDPFGVLTAPTMAPAQLGAQMRATRPMVERPAKYRRGADAFRGYGGD